MGYSGHESFYLRDKWVSKGLKGIQENPHFFYDKDSGEKIGLGKNMVQSLRFWLRAMDLVEIVDNKEHAHTELGRLIYSVDRLLQKNETISILHYHLVRNDSDSTTVFNWFFNTYKETVAQKKDILESFKTWVKNNETKEVSDNTLDAAVNVLIQQYTKEANEDDPENTIFSPFAKLNLIKVEASGEGNAIIRKISPEIDEIGLIPLYYVLLMYAEDKGVNLISLDEIINENLLWGKVFNLSRNKIIEGLNKLTNHDNFPIEYVRTNNLDNIKVPKINPLNYLGYEMDYTTRRVTNNGI